MNRFDVCEWCREIEEDSRSLYFHARDESTSDSSVRHLVENLRDTLRLLEESANKS